MVDIVSPDNRYPNKIGHRCTRASKERNAKPRRGKDASDTASKREGYEQSDHDIYSGVRQFENGQTTEALGAVHKTGGEYLNRHESKSLENRPIVEPSYRDGGDQVKGGTLQRLTSNGKAERPADAARSAPRAHTVFQCPRCTTTYASRPAPAIVRSRTPTTAAKRTTAAPEL